MAYNPTIWINDDGTGTIGTPATANNFNNMEQGIKNNELAISEHTEQINVLTRKIYSGFGELGQGFSQNTPFVNIENTMANGSILIASTYMPDTTNVYPSVSGTLIITKAVSNRTKLEFTPYTGGYYFGYMDSGFTGWQQIATTQRTIITSYLNSWSAWGGAYNLRLDKIGGRVICSGILVKGIVDNGTVICSIPTGYRPINGIEPRFLKGNKGDSLMIAVRNNGDLYVDTSGSTSWATTTSTLVDFSCSWEV